jgi:hypothetical protein
MIQDTIENSTGFGHASKPKSTPSTITPSTPKGSFWHTRKTGKARLSPY